MLVLVAAAALAAGMAVPTSSFANYFGLSNGDGCCRFADNGEHTFNFVTTGNQSYVDAMNHAFDHLDNGTDMTTKKVDKTSVTDVLFYADFFGGCCAHGTWQCHLPPNAAGECESGDAKLNRSNLDGAGQHAKDHTACHEIGHSTGLDHSHAIDSCLEQGIDEPKWMSEHDKEHISGRW